MTDEGKEEVKWDDNVSVWVAKRMAAPTHRQIQVTKEQSYWEEATPVELSYKT